MSNVDTSSFVDFWLNKDQLKKYEAKPTGSKNVDGFTVDLIQLSAYRRVISNFVRILTNKPIPVQFSDTPTDTMNFTDGDIVWLSSSVRRKADFDWSIGIALHEGAHILLSDFKTVKATFMRSPLPVPSSLRMAAKKKKISTNQLAYLCKWTFNYVEDRYIDSFIFREAPGYRGYYNAMYKRLWNSPRMSKGLKSKAFRVPNLRSYEFRVINLTNEDTELDALPGLREIATLLDLSNIFRLKTTRDRLTLGYKIAETIINNLGACKIEKEYGSNDTVKKIHDMIGEADDPKPGKNPTDKQSGESEESGGSGEPDDKELEKAVSKFAKEKSAPGKSVGDDEESDEGELDQDSDGDTSEFSEGQIEDIEKDFKKQQSMLKHDYRDIKETVSESEKSLLDVIEKYGIILVPTGRGAKKGDSKNTPAVDCIVVTKLTRELIEAGRQVFPMSAIGGGPGAPTEAPQHLDEAVSKGFVLGKLLGKKLQIRGEVNVTKFIRKTSGKIERRLLAGIGAGQEDIFNRTMTQKFNRARLHISVDASSSMDSMSKWMPTMTCLTAICVAAAMVDNLFVSVSFRCTHRLSDGTELPYVVLAYDSEHDKVSKIRQLFPFLTPYGCTPEGLAFEAIMNNFIVGKKTDEQDHYFLNISDGEPYYMLRPTNDKYKSAFDYSDDVAVRHTKRQIEKIRSQGVKVLSYFIQSADTISFLGTPMKMPMSHGDELRRQFEMMYGKDSKVIDVTNVTDIARTLNEVFLRK